MRDKNETTITRDSHIAAAVLHRSALVLVELVSSPKTA
jgi:hypothetical protein